MLRIFERLIQRTARPEHGQALVLFAAGLIAFLGLVGLSVDVGRLVWARTSIQAGVDASALAAAQSMPDQTDAVAKANAYWIKDSSFIQSQGKNVTYTVTFPPGNKALHVDAEADIDTWFMRIFGVTKWHVSADGDAASQVLDIAVVLDISGSMCNHPALPSFPSVETGNAIMSPGRATPYGGHAFPVLADGDTSTGGNQDIPASGANSITIKLNDISIFTDTNTANNQNNFGTSWNATTGSPAVGVPYWQRSFSNVRAGIIMMANSNNSGYELFQITAVNVANKTLTVTRAMANNRLGVAGAKGAHTVGTEIWANRYTGAAGSSHYCEGISKNQPTTTTNGPTHPFDDAVDNAKTFISLFNPSYDKIGLASFSTTSNLVSGLSSNFAGLNTSLDGILYPDGSTNIADGIARGQSILDGPGKRANAVRVIVVLTDGIPNQYCTGGYAPCGTVKSVSPDPSSCPYGSNTAITEAIAQAGVSKTKNTVVYTIGLGAGVLDCILTDVATAGGGKYFKAPTPADLASAFTSIAELTHIALIK